MVPDHPQDKDWLPARDYFEEGKELVFFADRKDLLDKCGYYLAHEDERRQIAGRMRRRALGEHTCTVAAERVLSEWRKVLRRSGGIGMGQV